MDLDLKQCTSCKDWKGKSNFFKHRTGKEGLSPTCKRCSAKKSYQYYSRPKYRYKYLLKTAKERGKEVTITLPEYTYVIGLDCFYCDGFLGRVKFCMGLDRIDNKKGYEFMNVLPCCTICNRARGDHFSVEETRFLIQQLVQIRKNNIGAIT